MAKLGEAYVEVRADLDKFGKDLDRGLLALTNKFEKSLNSSLGKKLGTDVGRGTREGIVSEFNGIGKELDKALSGVNSVKSRGRKVGRELSQGIGDGIDEHGPIAKALSNVITAFEDGFSSLPVEAKAAVAGAILALTPIVLGGVAALVNVATLGLATTVGTILAFQFKEVQDRGQETLDNLRERAVSAARFFIDPLDKAFDTIDYRLALLQPTLDRLFERASQFVGPLTDATLGLVDETIRGIERGLEALDIPGVGEATVQGLRDIGVELGELFETLLANENTDEVLLDLFESVATLVAGLKVFLNFGLDVYGFMIDLANVMGNVADAIGDVVSALVDLATFNGTLDNLTAKIKGVGDAWLQDDMITKNVIKTTDEYNVAADGTLRLTKKQEKAQKELIKQLKAQNDLVNDLISTNVDYQEAVDNTIAGFKEYKTSLDAGEEAGRGNIRNIQSQIDKLKEYVTAQVTSGKMTEGQARTYYNNEIQRLRDEFTKRGGNIKQFEEIFGWLTKLAGFQNIPDKFGPFRISLQDTATLLNAVTTAVTALANAPKPAAPKHGTGRGPQPYADGGFINEPTFGMLGENYRREVVLPLTQPQRSMSLLAKSPLAGMLGGTPNVNVFVGNEQLASRQFAVATGVSRANARSMTQRPRSI
jgi:hypothetical protein